MTVILLLCLILSIATGIGNINVPINDTIGKYPVIIIITEIITDISAASTIAFVL